MSNAKNIADERLAKGEISKAEYDELLNTLSERKELTNFDYFSAGLGIGIIGIVLFFVWKFLFG